jgi:hypothetical protein
MQYNMASDKFSGMDIEWDYTACRCRISMPGYIFTLLLKFKHPHLPKPCLSSYKRLSIAYGLSLTSHLILTLWNSSMLAANALCKKLSGHFCTTQGQWITNILLLSAPPPPAKPRPPLPQNKRWTPSSTILLPIQMTA